MRLIRERHIAPTIEEHAVSEAIAWHARLHGGHASAKDVDAFRAWLSASPYHPVAVTLVEDSWDVGRLLTVTAPAPRGSLWQRKPVRWAAIGTTAMAASLVLALVAAPVRTERYATGIGESRAIALADGSHIYLNADSRVEVEYRRFSRDLTMSRGDAAFDVAPDRLRPFTVKTTHGAVRALGTRFSVSDRRQESVVTLSEGAVQLRDLTDDIVGTMQPGQKAVMRADGRKPVIARLDPDRDLAWRHGLIVLDDESLGDATARFARYARVEISFADPALARLRVSGVYRGQDVDSFLGSVGRLYGLAVETPRPGQRNISRKTP